LDSTAIYTLCNGDSILVHEKWYYEATEFSFSKSGPGKCDSVFNITILQNKPDFLKSEYSVCGAILFELGSPVNEGEWNNGSYSDKFVTTESGSYSLKWFDSNGCIQIEEFNVTFNNNREVSHFSPNVISPNFDGINDEFRIYFSKDTKPTNYSLLIFDRWGNRVFKSTEISEEWYPGSKNLAYIEGVYSYKLQYSAIICDQQEEILEYGTITIIK